MKKLASFTIIELTVSLLISSIVISIGYYAYLLASRQFDKYLIRSSIINEYYLIEKVLQTDFDRSDEIRDSATGLLVFESESKGLIRYELTNEFIIRRTEDLADSFKVNNPQLDLLHVDNASGMVRVAKLVFGMGNESFSLIFRKQYSSEQLMFPMHSKHE